MESCSLGEAYSLIITCEHGGNRVPSKYASLFRGRKRLLKSPRGYDYGALELARKLSSSLRCPLYYSTITRLLVDLNRSVGNPKLYSEVLRGVGEAERENINNLYYQPYRNTVRNEMDKHIRGGASVVHISVHSFEPFLRGKERKADIGLLYDPKRKRESWFCSMWRRALLSEDGSLRIKSNYPYLGISDGQTTFLRRIFPEDEYIGIEIEVNERFPRGARPVWLKLIRTIAVSLRSMLGQRT